MTDKYIILTKTVSRQKILSTAFARFIIEHWMSSLCLSSNLLTDNAPQSISEVFVAFRSTFMVQNVTSTEYHQQISSQAESYSPTIVSRLSHYVSKHQTDWDTYSLPMAYEHNVQVYRSTKGPSFSLALKAASSGLRPVPSNAPLYCWMMTWHRPSTPDWSK